MNFDVQVAHSVEEVGQEAWELLGPDLPFASYRWYRLGEAALANDVPLYLILSHAGEPIARATFWLKRQESLPVRIPIVRVLMGAVLRRWPLLACRSPLSSTSGLILPDPPLRDEALKVIVQYAREFMRQYRASFLLFDYLDRQEMEWPGWPDDLVKITNMDPGTQLVINWPDFEGYLAHLSKKHRYNIKRNYRLAVEQGISIRCHPAVTDVDKAMSLHKNVNRRYKSPTDHWMRGLMENADMVDSLWLAAEKDGQLVGCELMLGDRGTWYVTGLGLDYEEKNVYFLLAYEDIRYAIEHGVQVLRWGTETYDVKRRFGFEVGGNTCLVFAGRWALLQRFGRWAAHHSLY